MVRFQVSPCVIDTVVVCFTSAGLPAPHVPKTSELLSPRIVQERRRRTTTVCMMSRKGSRYQCLFAQKVSRFVDRQRSMTSTGQTDKIRSNVPIKPPQVNAVARPGEMCYCTTLLHDQK